LIHGVSESTWALQQFLKFKFTHSWVHEHTQVAVLCKKSIGYQCNKDTNHIIPMGLILNVDETPHSNFGVGRCSNGGGTTEIVVFCHFHVVWNTSSSLTWAIHVKLRRVSSLLNIIINNKIIIDLHFILQFTIYGYVLVNMFDTHVLQITQIARSHAIDELWKHHKRCFKLNRKW